MTAIDEIITSSLQPSDLIDKINELVRACNTLESNLDGEWTTSGTVLEEKLSLNSSSNRPISLGSCLPDDDNLYECHLMCNIESTGNEGVECPINLYNTSRYNKAVQVLGTTSRGSSASADKDNTVIPFLCKHSDTVTVGRSTTFRGLATITLLKYRKVR